MLLIVLLWTTGAMATMLDTVKGRGVVVVGVSGKVPGFSAPDDKGVWRGLDVDFGRALAAAIFNDPEKVKFVP
ncbi:MAG: amino acid ABC transporter substrate-binding protein, partial [Acidobacteriota bacterium]